MGSKSDDIPLERRINLAGQNRNILIILLKTALNKNIYHTLFG